MDLIGLYSNPGSQSLPVSSLEEAANDGSVTASRPRRQHQRRLSSKEIERLSEDRRAGMTVMELADRYGIHRTTVMNHLKTER